MKETNSSRLGKASKNTSAAPGSTRKVASRSAVVEPLDNKPPLTVSRPELLVNNSDREFRRLVQGLLPFLAAHTAIRDGYAALLGLTGPQYTIMLCIRNFSAKGILTVKAVANHLRQSSSFIATETKALEREGLIAKVRSLEDRRAVALSLTKRGESLLDSIAEMRQRVNDVQFGSLTSEEFRMLVPVVERLISDGERALALLNYLGSQSSSG